MLTSLISTAANALKKHLMDMRQELFFISLEYPRNDESVVLHL
jgi:hypothetical protein